MTWRSTLTCGPESTHEKDDPLTNATSVPAASTPRTENRATRRARKYSHTIQQIAELYGVDPRTVRRWIASGRIDAVRVGPRLIRLDPDDVADRLFGPVGGSAA